MRLKTIRTAGVGFLAGIVFVAACPSPQDVASGVNSTAAGSTTGELFGSSSSGLLSASTANAAEGSKCGQWAAMRTATGWGYDEPLELPLGWEPFHVDPNGMHLRRCID